MLDFPKEQTIKVKLFKRRTLKLDILKERPSRLDLPKKHTIKVKHFKRKTIKKQTTEIRLF